MPHSRERIHDGTQRISVCPTKISIKTEKTYKERKMTEIMATLRALLNSDGGKVILNYEKAPPKHHVVDCIRIIEQRVKELTSCTTVANLTLDVLPQQLIIKVKGSCRLTTMNYNLHLPSESQVMSLPSNEPPEKIKEIIQSKVTGVRNILIGSHLKHFVRGEFGNLRESKKVCLKNLKATPSKCVTLADRITGKSNKLVCYISAFANHSGGHIYYGIKEDGVVEGQKATEKDKEEIIKKVSKRLNKMIWPEHSGKPQRGQHWDIHFEAVNDSYGNIIPSIFVIVIYIGRCPGGVFTEEPESYHVSHDGCVEKMSFHMWLSHFTERPMLIPSTVPPITWRSEKSKKIYRQLTTRLVKFRNNSAMVEFENTCEFAKEMFTESNAVLVVLSQQVI